MIGAESKNSDVSSIVAEMRSLEKNGSLSLKSIKNDFYEQDILKEYMNIFEKLHEGIFLFEGNSEIIKYVNKKAADFIGLKKDEIVGKPKNYFIHPLNQINDFSSKNESDESKTFSLNTKNGENIIIFKESTHIFSKDKSYIVENFLPINFNGKCKKDEIERKEQLLKKQEILLDLSKKHFQNFKNALEYITEKVVECLSVDRCGFWLFNQDRSQIRCQDVYIRDQSVHMKGGILHSKKYPHYFEALEREIVVDAIDAKNDARTNEFKNGYLKEFNIISMFDFPVRLHGKMIGIICCEYTKEKRYLTDDEKSFVNSISDYLSLQFEKENRLKVERELRKSKKQADEILEAAADGIRIINSDFKIVDANKTIDKLFKSDEKECIGKYCYDFLPSEYCGTDECSIKKVYSTKKGFLRESKRKTSDGKQINCIDVVKPYIDDKGNIIGIIEDIRDITYLKKTRLELMKEKKKVREYLDVATVILIVLDYDGNIIIINKKGCETLGYKDNELIGKNWFEIVSPSENTDKHKELYQAYMAGNISFPEESFNQVITKDNEKRLIKWNSTKISDESGKQPNMLSSGEDITEETRAKEAKKKADEILERRNNAFRILYDTALNVENRSKPEVIELLCNNLIKISDSCDGFFLLCDSKNQYLTFYGINSEKNEHEVCLQNISDELFESLSDTDGTIIPSMNDEIVQILPKEFLENYQLNDGIIYQISKPLNNNSFITGFILKHNNEKLTMKDMIDTYLNFAGIILQRIQSQEDLIDSEKRYRKLSNELEVKVEQRTKNIQKLLKQKDAFINQLGHDLKHPINPLINLLPILEKKNSDPKCKEILNVLQRNTGYMKNLITKTIKFAQLNAPSTEFIFEDTNIFNEINMILEKQKFLFEKLNIDVINDINRDISAQIDKLHFSELIDNLLNNAVKYGSKNGDIVIDGYTEENFVIVSIKDSGIGMNAEQIDHIFEEFYKADPARHDFDSSGLGMSICKRIVEKHGGRIWVESPGIGQGTMVSFTLPLNQ